MMRKFTAIASIIAALVAAAPVADAKQAWACQASASAGLLWRNNRWEEISLKLRQPFVLMQVNDTLTTESVAGVFGRSAEYADMFTCEKEMKATKITSIKCNGAAGETLLIDTRTGNGGFSDLFGALAKGVPPSVTAFTCQKY